MSVNNWRRRDWDSVRIIIWLLDSQSRMQQAPQQCANGVTWFAFQKGTTRENRERRDPWPLALFLLYPFHGNKTAEHTAHDDYSLMHLHAATGDIPTTKNETRSEKREKTSLLAFSLNRLNAARSLVRSFAAVRCVAVVGGLGIIFFDRLLHTLKEGERKKHWNRLGSNELLSNVNLRKERGRHGKVE